MSVSDVIARSRSKLWKKSPRRSQSTSVTRVSEDLCSGISSSRRVQCESVTSCSFVSARSSDRSDTFAPLRLSFRTFRQRPRPVRSVTALPSAVRAVSFGSCSMPDRLVSRLALTSNTSTPQAGRLSSEVSDWNCTETTVRLGKYARSDRSRISPRRTVTVWPEGSTASAVSTPAAAASTPCCGAANQYRSPQTYSAVRPLRSATVSSPAGLPA